MTAALQTEADMRLAQARRNLQRVLTARTQEHAERIFTSDDEFLRDADVIPLRATLIGQVVKAAQQILVTHVNQELSRKLGLRSAPGVSNGVFDRPGVTKPDEYARPFYTSLQLVRGGKSDSQAITAGVRRLHVMTATDLQMAKVRQARIALKAGGRATFKRVPTGDKPCELCETVSDQIYYTDNLMPIHANCMCDVEPDMSEDELREAEFGAPGSTVTADDEDGEDDEDKSQKKIEVREHGEIGPVLTWKNQAFTGPDDLPNPPEIIASYRGGLQRNRIAS